MEVEYDGERRSISCGEQACVVTCPDAECPEPDRDISVTTNRDDDGFLLGMEFAIGHMSERPSDGESSCRGAEDIAIDVTIGETVYERIELLDLSYERNEEYGGPGCGVADRSEAAIIPLQPV